jgi:hypothetical protein
MPMNVRLTLPTCRVAEANITLKLAVAHPSANGAVERLNKPIKTILKAHLNDNPTHWKAALATSRSAYVNSVHTAINATPNQMSFGFAPRVPLAV